MGNKQGTRWTWRTNEIQLAQFVNLSSTAKQEHLKLLLTLPVDELGTNDQFILRLYGPVIEQKTNKFLNLNEEK